MISAYWATGEPWIDWLVLGLCVACVLLLVCAVAQQFALKNRNAQLALNEQRISIILDSSGALVFIKDAQLNYLYVNQVMADLLGQSPGGMMGRDDFEFFDSGTAHRLRADDQRVLQGKHRVEVEQVFAASAKAEPQIYRAIKVPLFNSAGELTSVSTYATNITQERRAAEAQRLAATIFESQEGMLVADEHRIVLRVNKALLRLTGFEESELVGRRLGSLRTPPHDEVFLEQLWAQVAREGYWAGEMLVRRKHGAAYPAWINVTAVKGRGYSGTVTHYVSTHTDISELKAAEEEIHALAYFDSLTGLANRRLMSERLQRSLALSSRKPFCGALMVVDLDHFKDLNDTLGHDVGDDLLRQAAARLEQCVQRGDTVARLGGDEFVLLLNDLPCDESQGATQAEAVARRVLAIIDKPFALGDWTHHLSCSIGIALYSDANAGVNDLLKRGNLAMSQAKAMGRNTLSFFDVHTQQAVAKRARIESELRSALENNQLVLHYQAQVQAGGQMVGAEALLRWQHPVFGLMGPGEFIGIAESAGLILPMGTWVLKQALQQLQRWSATPQTAGLSIAVNVSMRQFRQSNFVENLLDLLLTTGANPARLKLELTESLFLENSEVAIAHMAKLRTLGVQFALDDFGTGYSSLAYLKRLPLDQLKIDKSFVQEAPTNANDAAIVRTIVNLAQSLELSVIAEGVETEEQRALLESCGCLTWQGYLFSRPAPVDEMLALFLQTTQSGVPCLLRF